ncbi:MAG: hypothetical protein V1859_06910 [archaeon]
MKKIIAILIMLALFITACKSSNTSQTLDKKEDVKNPTEDIQEDAVKDEKLDEPLLPDKKNTEDSTISGLKALITNVPVQYKVKYNYASNGQGQSVTGVQTIAIKPGKIKMIMESSKGNSGTYFIGDKYYSCTTVNGKATCFEIPKSQGESTIPKNDDVKNSIDEYTVTALPTRTIAGVSATCVRLAREGVIVDSCYSAQGVPLYTKGSYSSASTEMTALEFTTSVPDSEFVLPVESSGMQGIPNMPKIPEMP